MCQEDEGDYSLGLEDKGVLPNFKAYKIQNEAYEITKKYHWKEE